MRLWRKKEPMETWERACTPSLAEKELELADLSISRFSRLALSNKHDDNMLCKS